MHMFRIPVFTYSAVDCGEPLTVVNASSQPPSPDTTYGGTVTYTCTSGVLVGGATVTCEASRNWSTTPTCVGEHATMVTIYNGMFRIIIVLVPIFTLSHYSMDGNEPLLQLCCALTSPSPMAV